MTPRLNAPVAAGNSSSEICHVPRSYQDKLYKKALDENIIAILGTGAGKTLIAVMLIRYLHNIKKQEMHRCIQQGLQTPKVCR
jgi:replicative superfamily II helicase